MLRDSRHEAEELCALQEEQIRRNRLIASAATNAFTSMYVWQRDFVRATADYFESCLCAANQIGKTFTGTTIDAMHLLGDYPDDWDGYQFDFAPLVWALGYSMEKTRDLLQTALFGLFRNREFEGGLIPKDRIVGWESAGGTINAMRTVRVSHKSGEVATMQFWSYSQGQHAMMGDVVDWFHVDEDPRDQTIAPQLITRTINGDQGRGGRGIYTFTPENGRTEMIVKFMDDPSPSQFFMQKGWADAPHMTPEKCERLLDQYPAYQRDMRSKGIPMLGHGRIYDLGDDFISCDPPDVPDHWYIINGMDFGWDHPQAHIQLVEDRGNGIFYVTRAYKARQVSANDAWGSVKGWSEGIPCAWPHDGLQNEKGRDDAVQQKVHYERAGFKMLAAHATWPEGGNSVESGLYEIGDLMRKGKFKFSRGLLELFNEFRQYHRDDKGRIVKAMDDLLDAVRYAFMMRRYSVRVGEVGVAPRPIKFTGWNG